jgi:hypothetical protein
MTRKPRNLHPPPAPDSTNQINSLQPNSFTAYLPGMLFVVVAILLLLSPLPREWDAARPPLITGGVVVHVRGK